MNKVRPELSNTSPLASALSGVRQALERGNVSRDERVYLHGKSGEEVQFEEVINDARPKLHPAEAPTKVKMFENLLSGRVKHLFPDIESFKDSERLVSFVYSQEFETTPQNELILFRDVLFYAAAIKILRKKFEIEKCISLYDGEDQMPIEAMVCMLEEVTEFALERQRKRILQLAMTPEQWVIDFPSCHEDLVGIQQFWRELFEFFSQISPR